ncbi:S8 family peptidase [Cryptosporangium sp. NPDC051539]|uniref:S8 family peptidase n=1 Tax=Cryptosporangium sp. NPDC051539 TaxID=3363962 RepID=UPI00379715CD
MRTPRRLATALTALSAAAMVAVSPGIAAADSVRSQSWQMDNLHVTDAQALSRGKGVVVAVIDDGVQTDHPDLTGNVLPGVDIYTGKPQAVENGEYHGTQMAALIAGHGHGNGNRDGVLGIAPDAAILPIKISYDGSLGDANNVTVAIRWALTHGADIISISLSVSFDADLPAALDAASAKNVPVIVGAGNDLPSALTALDGTVPVVALGPDGRIDPVSQGVDGRNGLAAPGADIPVPTGPGTYAPGTGTSYSTAIVAGAFALARAKYPTLTAEQLTALFYRHATDLGDRGPDVVYGNGGLNVLDALNDPAPITANTPSPSAAAAPVTAQSGLSAAVVLAGVLVLVLLLGVVVAVVALIFVRSRRRRIPDGAAPARLPVTGQPRAPLGTSHGKDDRWTTP